MFKLLKNLSKKDVFLASMSFALIVLQVWLELKMPDYMSEITKLVKTEGSSMNDILINGGYMLVCAFGSLLSAVVVGFFVSTIAANLSKNIRKKIFDKVQNMSINEIKKFSTSSLITRCTNDITQIQMLVSMGLQLAIKSPITAVWAISKILNKSWEWSALTGITVVFMMTVIAILMIMVVPRFKLLQKLTDRINGVTRENLTGIRVVRAFNAESYQEHKFDKVNNELTGTQLFNQRKFAIMQPLMISTMNILTVLVYFVGAYLIGSAALTDKLTIFGNMIVFSSYAIQVILSFLMLALIFMMFPRGQVSAKRINEVLDEEITVKDCKKSNAPVDSGTIEFRDVSFKYPDAEEYLLKDITFKAKKGDFVAIIGLTGSGKSTLINLIPRFYDVTEGAVFVDGVNVKNYKQEDLHNLIGYVPQKAVMFEGTIKSNVTYGDNGKGPISDEQVKKAVEIAQASDFVEKMDGAYEAHVSQGGTNLSGGQKQRIAIARAIARNPEIYIFDDSFSALDYKTDAALRKSLKEHAKEATIVVVAQRIGTIMNADKIIVLQDGRTIGIGTHKELMRECEVYKEIALSQLSKEELENA